VARYTKSGCCTERVDVSAKQLSGEMAVIFTVSQSHAECCCLTPAFCKQCCRHNFDIYVHRPPYSELMGRVDLREESATIQVTSSAKGCCDDVSTSFPTFVVTKRRLQRPPEIEDFSNIQAR